MPVLHLTAKSRSRVPDVGDAAGHAGREVAARGAENHRAAAGHVLAAVVADAFDDGLGAAVAHAEPLGGAAAEERAAARRAVQRDVADEDVVLGLERGDLRRIDDETPARQALADVVVAVAFELERDALRQERAEALSGRARELEAHGVVGQRVGAPLLDDLVAQHRADGAIRVRDRQLFARLLALLNRLLRERDEAVVEREIEAVILLLRAVDLDVRRAA